MMGEGCSEKGNSVQSGKKKISLILRERRAERGRGKSMFTTKNTLLNRFVVPVTDRRNDLETWTVTKKIRSIWVEDWLVTWTRNTKETLRPLACSKSIPFFLRKQLTRTEST